MISLTDSAVKQLQTLAQDEGKGLRIFVENGGCAGMQYGMTMDAAQEGDLVTERDGVQVIVDTASAKFLQGSTIDYTDDLTGTGFRIRNPNAARSCGCGTSFEPGESPAAAQ